jgi:hypothetical protein
MSETDSVGRREVTEDDLERKDLHQHQLNKYNDPELEAIANKGDRGEPLTTAEQDT